MQLTVSRSYAARLGRRLTRVCSVTGIVVVIYLVYLILSEMLSQFHSQFFPLSGEQAWLQTGRSLSRESQRKIMMIGLPLKVSLVKKCPTPFSNEPTTGGSRMPVLLGTQYSRQSRVFGS